MLLPKCFRAQTPVEVRVTTNALGMATVRNVRDQRCVATGEKRAQEFVPPVEPAGVSGKEPFHARDPIRLGRPDHDSFRALQRRRRKNLPGAVRGSGMTR